MQMIVSPTNFNVLLKCIFLVEQEAPKMYEQQIEDLKFAVQVLGSNLLEPIVLEAKDINLLRNYGGL